MIENISEDIWTLLEEEARRINSLKRSSTPTPYSSRDGSHRSPTPR